jgi:hypothetical protein
MKRVFACVLVLAMAAGSLAAQSEPLGLTVYIDGFGFGNVAGDEYEFSGENGGGEITIGVEFAKTFGAIDVSTSLEDTIGFTDPLSQDIAWTVKGEYGLGLSEASSLSFWAWNKLHLIGGDDEFADTDLDQIQDEFAPGIRFDQKLGFGTIYAIVEVAFVIHTADGVDMDIGTSFTGFDHPSNSMAGFGDEGIKIGIETDMGVYGFIQPEFVFSINGETPDDVLCYFNIGAGYATGPIDAYVTAYIPTFEDGVKLIGLTVTPGVSYEIIPDALSAYAEFELSGIGADEADKGGTDFGFSPTIGVSYSF